MVDFDYTDDVMVDFGKFILIVDNSLIVDKLTAFHLSDVNQMINKNLQGLTAEKGIVSS